MCVCDTNRWMPETGGSNIPALNELLREFGIALGESVLEGYFDMGSHGMYYASGSSLIRFPQVDGAILIERDLHDQGLEVSGVTGRCSNFDFDFLSSRE